MILLLLFMLFVMPIIMFGGYVFHNILNITLIILLLGGMIYIAAKKQGIFGPYINLTFLSFLYTFFIHEAKYFNIPIIGDRNHFVTPLDWTIFAASNILCLILTIILLHACSKYGGKYVPFITGICVFIVFYFIFIFIAGIPSKDFMGVSKHDNNYPLIAFALLFWGWVIYIIYAFVHWISIVKGKK